jgi:hypothetical protein
MEQRPEAICHDPERGQQTPPQVVGRPRRLRQITDGGHDVQAADAIGGDEHGNEGHQHA